MEDQRILLTIPLGRPVNRSNQNSWQTNLSNHLTTTHSKPGNLSKYPYWLTRESCKPSLLAEWNLSNYTWWQGICLSIPSDWPGNLSSYACGKQGNSSNPADRKGESDQLLLLLAGQGICSNNPPDRPGNLSIFSWYIICKCVDRKVMQTNITMPFSFHTGPGIC